MKDAKDMTTLELLGAAAHSAVCLSERPVLKLVALHKNLIEEAFRRDGVELDIEVVKEQWSAIGDEMRELHRAAVKEEKSDLDRLLEKLMGSLREEGDDEEVNDFIKQMMEEDDDQPTERQVIHVSREADLERVPKEIRPQVAQEFKRLAEKLSPSPATAASAGGIEHSLAYLRAAVGDDLDGQMAVEALAGHIEELDRGGHAPGSLRLVTGEKLTCESSCCEHPTELVLSLEGDAFIVVHRDNAFAPAKFPDGYGVYRLAE